MPRKAYPSASGTTKCCGRQVAFVLDKSRTRWLRMTQMTDFPRSLIEFQQRFSNEAACVEYLFAARWPQGFRCPGCGNGKAWQLQTKPWTWECAGCGKQTSVTAGTIMHHSKLPLTTWFWATYLMATHSNGISALQLQRQLALGSYKTAWLMCAKLRRSMLTPDRSPLAGLVEVDETEIACRSKHHPLTGGGGRSHQGKMLIVGAVEVQDGGAGPGRIRLAEVADYSTSSLHPFVAPKSRNRGDRQDRWMVRLPRCSRRQPRSPCHRQDGRPRRAAVGAPHPSRSGPWASITACAAGISNPTSTNSSFASTAGAAGTPPSAPCSASPPATRPSPTKC